MVDTGGYLPAPTTRLPAVAPVYAVCERRGGKPEEEVGAL